MLELSSISHYIEEIRYITENHKKLTHSLSVFTFLNVFLWYKIQTFTLNFSVSFTTYFMVLLKINTNIPIVCLKYAYICMFFII